MQPLGKMAFGATALVVGSLAVVGPSEAGFFDFLFRPQPQVFQPQVYQRYDRPLTIRKWRRHASSPRHDDRTRTAARYRELDEETAAAPVSTPLPFKPQIALCCKNGESPVRALLRDPTLQPGDAVMMPTGLRIFLGSADTDAHRLSDFVALSSARSRAVANKKLKEIDDHTALMVSRARLENQTADQGEPKQSLEEIGAKVDTRFITKISTSSRSQR